MEQLEYPKSISFSTRNGPLVGMEIALQLSLWSRDVVIRQCENECRYRCNIVEEGNYCQSNVSFVDLFSMGKFFIR